MCIVDVAIEAIGKELGCGHGALQWVINAYTVAFAATVLGAESIADKIGARRVLVIGFIVFGLSSLGCALNLSFPLLITARVIQGVAGIAAPDGHCRFTLTSSNCRTAQRDDLGPRRFLPVLPERY